CRVVRRSRASRPKPRHQADHCISGRGAAGVLAEASANIELDDRDTPAVTHARASRYGADQGAAAVEASLTLSVLLLLIICTVEFGRAMWTQNTMLLAVQEAGRFAMISSYAPSVGCGVQSQAP